MSGYLERRTKWQTSLIEKLAMMTGPYKPIGIQGATKTVGSTHSIISPTHVIINQVLHFNFIIIVPVLKALMHSHMTGVMILTGGVLGQVQCHNLSIVTVMSASVHCLSMETA